MPTGTAPQNPLTRRPAPTTPRRARSRRRRRVLLPLTALLVGVLLLSALLLARHPRTGAATGADEVVAVVGTHRVERAEFLFHVSRLAPSMPGSSAADVAHRALAEIARDDTLLQLAHERHLVDVDDFAGLERARQAENASRAQAVRTGQVVYGLSSFDMPEFYAHTLADLRAQLEQSMSSASGGPLAVSAAEVAAAYDADPPAWSANVATLDYTELRVPQPVFLSGRCAAAVSAAGPRFEELTTPATACPGATTRAGTLAPAPQGPMATGPAVQALRGAALGTVTAVQPEGSDPDHGDVVRYRLDATRADRTTALQAYGQRIRQSLVQQKFQDHLTQHTPTPVVELPPRRLLALTTEGMSS